jgi:two-component system, LuxR family, sensor kinase FixL
MSADEHSILQAILKVAPDAIIRLSGEGTILDFFGRAPDVFGYSADEIVGKPFSLLMSEADAAPHAEFIETFANREVQQISYTSRRMTARHKDGSSFPLEAAVSQIGSGDDMQFVGILRDITARVENEAKISKLREAVELNGRKSALGEMAVTIAHELNQPLTAIANYMDALELRLKQEDREENIPLISIAQKTGSQARMGGEIVKRIRRMVLRESNETQPGHVHEAVLQTAELFEEMAETKGVELIVECKGDDGNVLFNRLHLHQVLVNLVRNALKALETADVKKIIISSEVREDEVELRVTDTGPGVPDERKQAIFEGFINSSVSGLGVGLPIARRIAAAHFGKIWVEDNPEGGAVFRVLIPLS